MVRDKYNFLNQVVKLCHELQMFVNFKDSVILWKYIIGHTPNSHVIDVISFNTLQYPYLKSRAGPVYQLAHKTCLHSFHITAVINIIYIVIIFTSLNTVLRWWFCWRHSVYWARQFSSVSSRQALTFLTCKMILINICVIHVTI